MSTGHRQRLKDRFNAGDPRALTDGTLLELLLTYAIPQKDLQPLAQELIAEFGTLNAVLTADVASLKRVAGIGDAAVTLLRLSGFLAKRREADSEAVPTGLAEAAPAAETPATQPPRIPEATTLPEVPAKRSRTVPPARNTEPAAQAPRPAATVETAATDQYPAPLTRWRAGGRYIAANMLKPGMVPEIQLSLAAYARIGDLAETRRYLLDEGLPQRSRETRGTIAGVIAERLASWNPPRWVCRELLEISAADDLANLKLLLLLHTARQDILLYEIVQYVVAPRWREGVPAISHVDMQRFLDEAAPTHPEIATWSRATREKLAGNLLTVLRDYGLLVGTATKRIVEPAVTPLAVRHLEQLLSEEGIVAADVADHADWALWLLDPSRTRALLAAHPGDDA